LQHSSSLRVNRCGNDDEEETSRNPQRILVGHATAQFPDVEQGDVFDLTANLIGSLLYPLFKHAHGIEPLTFIKSFERNTTYAEAIRRREMTENFDPLIPSEWVIDLPGRLATHITGLQIGLSPDALFADKWSGRCINARVWADVDPDNRGAQLPRLLHAGVAAFTRAHRQSMDKRTVNFFPHHDAGDSNPRRCN
jgi:hypothetical protein